MNTQSKKAKGRRLQNLVRDALLFILEKFNIVNDDIQSTSMGAQGVDIKLSPAVQKLVGPLAIECKNVEALNVTGTYFKHCNKYPEHTAVLVHKRNNSKPLVTIDLEYFMLLLMEFAKRKM